MTTKQPGLSRGQRFERMETIVKTFDQRMKNLEMSHRIFQAMLERIAKTIEPMGADLRDFIGKQRDMQYRLLAMQDMLKMDITAINTTANDLQIKDFHEASDKEDAEKQYLIGEVVTEDSAVILTSTTPDEVDNDKGILRSKLLMSEISIPQLRDDLMGKTVGDKISTVLNGVKHEIEILGIRIVPKPIAVEDEKQEEAKA
jgi:hypothetical protein